MEHSFSGAYPEYWSGPLRWCHSCFTWVAPEDIFGKCDGPMEPCPCCLGMGDDLIP